MKIRMTTAFKKDRKRCQKRHYDINFMDQIIASYAANSGFTDKEAIDYYDHPLQGNWKGHREFHPYGHDDDWVVIYHLEGGTVVLDNTGDSSTMVLDRTGTHSDVFTDTEISSSVR